MEEDKKTLQMWLDRYKRWEKFSKDHRLKWDRYYQVYRCYVEKRDDGLSNIFIPFIFSIIETILPRLIEAHFGTKPWAGVLPVGPEDVPGAKAMEQILQFQMEERINFVEKSADWFKEDLILGTSIGLVTWRVEQHVRQKLQRKQIVLPGGFNIPLPAWESRTVRETTYDDNDFQHIDLHEFWFEPRAKDIESALYCGHFSYENWAYLKMMEGQGVYKNLDLVEKTVNEEKSAAFKRLNDIGLGSDSNDGNDKDDQVHKLQHCFEGDWYTVIADDEVVIRDGPNPYYHKRKPYARIVDIPVPHEFYGIGEVEPAEYLQYALNDLTNAQIDYVMMSILGVFLRREGSKLTLEDLKLHARKVIDVEDVENPEVKPWQFPSIDPTSFTLGSLIKDYISNTTGAQDVVRGQLAPKQTTAFEISTVQQMAEARFRLKVRLINQMGIRQVARLMAFNNQQFIRQDRAIRMLGPEKGQYLFPKFKPEELQGNFDFIPAGVAEEPLLSKENKRESLKKLLAEIGQDPLVKRRELLKKVVEAYDIEDVNEVLKTDEEIAAEQQAAADAQAAAQGGLPPAQPEAQPQLPPEIPPEMMGGMMNG